MGKDWCPPTGSYRFVQKLSLKVMCMQNNYHAICCLSHHGFTPSTSKTAASLSKLVVLHRSQPVALWVLIWLSWHMRIWMAVMTNQDHQCTISQAADTGWDYVDLLTNFLLVLHCKFYIGAMNFRLVDRFQIWKSVLLHEFSKLCLEHDLPLALKHQIFEFHSCFVSWWAGKCTHLNTNDLSHWNPNIFQNTNKGYENHSEGQGLETTQNLPQLWYLQRT